jgi:hypothetical protein
LEENPASYTTDTMDDGENRIAVESIVTEVYTWRGNEKTFELTELHVLCVRLRACCHISF